MGFIEPVYLSKVDQERDQVFAPLVIIISFALAQISEINQVKCRKEH